MAESSPPRGDHPREDSGRVGYVGRGELYESATCLLCGAPRLGLDKPVPGPGLKQLRRFLCVDCMPR